MNRKFISAEKGAFLHGDAAFFSPKARNLLTTASLPSFEPLPLIVYSADAPAVNSDAAVVPSEPPKKKHRPEIKYWNGLRTVSCAVVVICHYMYMFFPAGAGLALATSPLSIFSTTPLRVLQEGQFALCIFFAISGYFLSNRYFRTLDSTALTTAAYQRYGRLSFPVLVSSLICFALVKTGLVAGAVAPALARVDSWWLADSVAHDSDMGLFDVVYQSLVVMFAEPFKYVLFNAPLWMMHWELVGSFISKGIALMVKAASRGWIIYALALLFYLQPANIVSCRFYIPMLIGVIVNDIEQTLNKNRKAEGKGPFKMSNGVSLALLGLSLYLGSYPRFNVASVAIKPDKPFFASSIELGWWGVIHAIGSFLVKPNKAYILWHSLATFGIMSCVAFSPLVQRFLDTDFISNSGRLTFGAFMLHVPILFTLGCWLYGVPFATLPHPIAAFLSFVASMAVMVPITKVFFEKVETPLSNFNRDLIAKIFDPLPTGSVITLPATIGKAVKWVKSGDAEEWVKSGKAVTWLKSFFTPSTSSSDTPTAS